MMSAIFFVILSAFFGLLLLLFDFLFVHESKKREGIEIITDPTTGKKRKRIFEGTFDQGTHDDIYSFGQALTSRVVFVESLVPLEKSVLIEALLSLAKIHPLLRMKCEWEESKGITYRYLTEMEKLTSRELLYSEINKERHDWVEILENELTKGFDQSSGPLWRVTRLKEEFDSTSNTYNNTVLFTFHHAICDGVSILNYLDKLLEVIDKIFYGDLVDENLEPLPLLEPHSVLAKHHIELPWTKSLSLKVKSTLQTMFNFKQSPRNLFLERFPPPMKSDPTIKAKTMLKPSCLPVEDTTIFLTNCKLHNCSVGGAIAASLVMAVINLIKSTASSSTDEVTYTLGIPVNTRSGCKPVVSNQYFGCYIGIIFIPFTIPTEILCINDYFWELARKMSTDIRQKISNDEQYGILKQFKYTSFHIKHGWEAGVNKSDPDTAGRYPNFELSNIGNYDLDKGRVYKIKEVYGGVAQDTIGPVVTVTALTVSGKLCWSVIHSSGAVSRELANDYSGQISQLIKEIGCRKE